MDPTKPPITPDASGAGKATPDPKAPEPSRAQQRIQALAAQRNKAEEALKAKDQEIAELRGKLAGGQDLSGKGAKPGSPVDLKAYEQHLKDHPEDLPLVVQDIATKTTQAVAERFKADLDAQRTRDHMRGMANVQALEAFPDLKNPNSELSKLAADIYEAQGLAALDNGILLAAEIAEKALAKPEPDSGGNKGKVKPVKKDIPHMEGAGAARSRADVTIDEGGEDDPEASPQARIHNHIEGLVKKNPAAWGVPQHLVET